MNEWENESPDFRIQKFGEDDIDEILEEELEHFDDQDLREALQQVSVSSSLGTLGDSAAWSKILPKGKQKEKTNQRKGSSNTQTNKKRLKRRA